LRKKDKKIHLYLRMCNFCYKFAAQIECNTETTLSAIQKTLLIAQ